MTRAFGIACFSLVVIDCGAAAPVASSAPSAPAASPVATATMVHIAGGDFLMGSPDGVGSVDEHPQHAVTVAPFDMDTTEVTVAAYAECVRAGACTPAAGTVDWSGIRDSDRAAWGKYCNRDRADRSSHPVNCVDWDQATAYCKWAGKRLPTEEEWEFAARGKEGRTYPWGEEAPDETRANGCAAECVAMAKEEGFNWSAMFPRSDQWSATAPVGTFPAGKTSDGLLDMAGNVWEWTATKYARYDGSHPSDRMVMRGGCWDSYMPRSLRGANRVSGTISEHRNTNGFRCAKSTEDVDLLLHGRRLAQ